MALRLLPPLLPLLAAELLEEQRVHRLERRVFVARLVARPVLRLRQPARVLLVLQRPPPPVVAAVVAVVLESVALRALLGAPAGAEERPHLLCVHFLLAAHAVVPFAATAVAVRLLQAARP